MLRIFAFSSAVLLYLAATQCVAVEQEASVCDEKSCDADCQKRFALSEKHAFGKCEGNVVCKCYRNLPCSESTCEKLCRERLGQESGIHSSCTDGQCHCSWDKEFMESERESRCSGTKGACKKKGGSAKRHTDSHETKASVAKQAAVLQQRVFHVFALGDEEVEPRSEKQQHEPADSA